MTSDLNEPSKLFESYSSITACCALVRLFYLIYRVLRIRLTITTQLLEITYKHLILFNINRVHFHIFSISNTTRHLHQSLGRPSVTCAVMANETFRPFFEPNLGAPEAPATASIITTLGMLPHIEGGYFVETDRDPLLIPSPFPIDAASEETLSLVPQRPGFDPKIRHASTSIFYLLTPNSPQGNFHRNRARTVHTLHKGRGKYVLIHEDGRTESFVVGQDVSKGERLQWVVEGGIYKASFLLSDKEAGDKSEEGLLISETVVPGFEYCDHDFMARSRLRELVGDVASDLEWLVRKDDVTLTLNETNPQ